ncbi:MAG: VanZ family protein [Bacteroidetes bacterium]|nr:VanZ family protein [Bacteroidota bacterium]
MKNFLTRNLWGILWIILIFVLTCIPGNVIPQVPTFLDLFSPDKLVHLFLFAVLIILLLRGFNLQEESLFFRSHALTIALNTGIFLGGITEMLQRTELVTGRVASIYDFIANVAGCFLGWWIFILLERRKERS